MNQFLWIKQIAFAAAFIVSTALQIYSPHHKNISTDFKNWRVNLSLGLLNSIIFAVTVGTLIFSLTQLNVEKSWGFFQILHLPSWVTVILSVVALDGVTYFWHRLNHKIKFLWRFHQVHHTDINFDSSTAVRFHLFEVIISFFIRIVAVLLLGVTPMGLLAFEIIYQFLNNFEHGNIKLPMKIEKNIERIFITPALHRKHHSRVETQLNSNFATIFSFWDRLFKTYNQSNSAEQFPIGLPTQIGDFKLIELIILPLSEE